MTKSLSSREKVLLVILVAVLIGALYYMAVWRPTHETITDANERIAELRDSLTVEEARAREIEDMRAALEEVAGPAESATITPLYDNFQNLLNELNYVVANPERYSLNFGDTRFENGIATRTLQLLFYADNYQQARDIISRISGGPYRNDVTSLRIVPDSSNSRDAVNSPIAVMIIVNYYEIYHEPAEARTDEVPAGE